MAVFIVSVISVAGLSISKSTTKPDTETKDKTTITGTPADNYPDDKRATFCGTGNAKSNRFITEFKIPTICTQPLAITTDPSGTVWFTESNTGRLAKFDPFSRQFTEYNNTQWPKGDRAMMWGITRTDDGNLWYTDEIHHAIWKFSIGDKNFSSFKYPVPQGGKSFPQKIVLKNDKILVNDFDGNRITFFDPTQVGKEIKYTSVNSPLNNTVTAALAIDSRDNIWYTAWNFQTGEGNLIQYDPQTSDGTRFNFPAGMRAPNGISVDNDDKIWISDTSSSFFFKFDPQSQLFTKFVTSPPQQTTYGNSSGVIKTPVTRPYWNSFDDLGRLWFNEQTGNSIAVFDPTKETLVEYLIPSQNPNWSDCGGLQNCGIAQTLDFAISGKSIWFSEWVENNIGVLDSSIPLPIDVSLDKRDLIISGGENATLSFTVTPMEDIKEPIKLITSTTAGLNDLLVTSETQEVNVGSQPLSVSLNVSADKFALPGTYKVLIGAQHNEVTISEYATVTIK